MCFMLLTVEEAMIKEDFLSNRCGSKGFPGRRHDTSAFRKKGSLEAGGRNIITLNLRPLMRFRCTRAVCQVIYTESNGQPAFCNLFTEPSFGYRGAGRLPGRRIRRQAGTGKLDCCMVFAAGMENKKTCAFCAGKRSGFQDHRKTSSFHCELGSWI